MSTMSYVSLRRRLKYLPMMKRYNILVHSFRNRKENFEDDVIGVCAGLWNLILSY